LFFIVYISSYQYEIFFKVISSSVVAVKSTDEKVEDIKLESSKEKGKEKVNIIK
jgi:hypothetical protein